jgi:hypothetical protein
MLSLKTILETIMTGLSTTMPGLLAAKGLTDYTEYIMGMVRDDKKSTITVMYDPDIPLDIKENRIPILYYANLYEIDYKTALLYVDLLLSFIQKYDSGKKIKLTLMTELSLDIIPIERERSTLIYITAIYTEPLDSCDEDWKP